MEDMLAGSIAKDSSEGVVVVAFSIWLPGLMSHAVVANAFHVLLYNVVVNQLSLIRSLPVHYLFCDATE